MASTFPLDYRHVDLEVSISSFTRGLAPFQAKRHGNGLYTPPRIYLEPARTTLRKPKSIIQAPVQTILDVRQLGNFLTTTKLRGVYH